VKSLTVWGVSTSDGPVPSRRRLTMSLELAPRLVHETSGGAERRFLDDTCDDLGPRQHLAYEAHRLSCVQDSDTPGVRVGG
jgi:hypothetical protein